MPSLCCVSYAQTTVCECALYVPVRCCRLNFQDSTHLDVADGPTSYTVSHLDTHTQYEFWVTAFTAVGEGTESNHVVQKPSDSPPAQIAAFDQQISRALHEELNLSCYAVGKPPIQLYWKKNASLHSGKRLHEDSHVEFIDQWLLHISDTQYSDNGNYSCLVENSYGSDRITYHVIIQVPPAPTNLLASFITISSISLRWQLEPYAEPKSEGHLLYYKREFGEWEKISLEAKEFSFTLDSLQCGTKYLIYLQAFNKFGESEQSNILSTHTQGSAPIAPSYSDLIQVNSSFISLNLSSWDDGNCPITSLVIEYRRKNEGFWILVSNNVKIQQKEFIILDLSPATWYTLRVTAHNSAGSTTEYYNFVTLTDSGDFIAPELIILSGYSWKPFYSSTGTVVLITGVAIAIVAAVVLLIYQRRSNIIECSSKCTAKTQEPDQLSDVGKVAPQKSFDGVDDTNGQIRALEQSYQPNPICLSMPHRQNVSPYATFQVPISECIYCSDAEDQAEQQVYNHKHHPEKQYGSGMDPMYSGIHQHIPQRNEKFEWIPLHNLYQAHRY